MSDPRPGSGGAPSQPRCIFHIGLTSSAARACARENTLLPAQRNVARPSPSPRAIGDFVKRPQIKPSRAQQGQALLTRPWWPRVKGYPGSGLSSCGDLGGFPPPTLLTAGILGAGLWLPAGEQFPLPV